MALRDDETGRCASDRLPRVGRTFESSLTALQATAEGLAIAAVAVAPWLPAIALIAVMAYFGLRTSFRMVRTRYRLARG